MHFEINFVTFLGELYSRVGNATLKLFEGIIFTFITLWWKLWLVLPLPLMLWVYRPNVDGMDGSPTLATEFFKPLAGFSSNLCWFLTKCIH